MLHNLKKIFIFLLLLCLMVSQAAWAQSTEAITVSEIQKHGNLVLSIPGTQFLSAGYAFGDIVSVRLASQEYEMPVGSNYTDVETGEMICRVNIDEGKGSDQVLLAINMGDFATAANIAAKLGMEEEPGYIWEYTPGLTLPIEVTISMKEEGGYYDQWLLRQLVRSHDRSDYPLLSDAEFANFRPIETTGMGKQKLYRSSSPVNPEIGRSGYADAAMEEAGIATVINLADSIIDYEGWEDGYYHSCSITALGLSVNFEEDHFRTGLARGLRAIIAGKAPFLVHCNEGKDRAGFVSAVLEALMGASAEEIIADYMTSYSNYYGVERGTEQYEAIACSNICKFLAAAFEIEDICDPELDLSKEARQYLLEQLFLTEDEIQQLKAKLS